MFSVTQGTLDQEKAAVVSCCVLQFEYCVLGWLVKANYIYKYTKQKIQQKRKRKKILHHSSLRKDSRKLKILNRT